MFTLKSASVAVLALTLALGVAAPAGATGTLVKDASDPEAITTACKADVVIIGARGSGQSANGYSTPGAGMGPEVKAAADALRSRLSSGTKVRYLSVIYPATNANWQTFLGTAYSSPLLSNYRSSVNYGVKNLKSRIAEVVKKCPKSKIVLMGYSQGAQVVHEAVLSLEKAGTTSSTSRIKSVVLIADPKNTGATIFQYTSKGSTSLTSYSTVKGWRGGLYTSAVKAPSILTSNKTISVCNPKDPVCNGPHLTGGLSPAVDAARLATAVSHLKGGAHGVYKASGWTSWPSKYAYAALKRAGVS